MRKSLLKKSRVYLILDRPVFNKFTLKDIVSLTAHKEIGLIQLRDKFSAKEEVLKFAQKLAKQIGSTKTLFIINDYVDVAVASLADGVHLGQEDLSLKQARKLLGQDKLIGVSCHNLTQALKAQQEGADYIGIGPLYATATKPGCAGIGLKVAAEVFAKIKIPCFAIGNIGEGNIEPMVAVGVKRIAVCRAILGANNPGGVTKRLYKQLKKI